MGDESRSILSEKEVAILAGGCFWCLEAVYDQVEGVKSVESGYIGGLLDSPTYEAVCGGQTGHAEAVRITFDHQVISYNELLEMFSPFMIPRPSIGRETIRAPNTAQRFFTAMRHSTIQPRP